LVPQQLQCVVCICIHGKFIMFFLTLLGLGLNFLLRGIVNENFIGCPRGIVATPLAPIIAATVGKQIPLCVESGTRNGFLDRTKGLETLLVVCVAKINK
jgi:hypothetical protein